MEQEAKYPPRDGTPSFDEAEERFLELVRSADLPEPDEVRAERDPDELIFMWNETKTAIIVELDPPAAELLAAEAAAARRVESESLDATLADAAIPWPQGPLH